MSRDDSLVLDALHHHLAAVFRTFDVGPRDAVILLEHILDEHRAEAEAPVVPADVDALFSDIETHAAPVEEPTPIAAGEIASGATFRRFKRHNIDVSVTVTSVDDGTRRDLHTRDISEGGLFVVTEHKPEAGSRHEIRIPTRPEPLTLIAKVVRVASDGLAFEFDEVEREQHGLLIEFITEAARAAEGAIVPRADEAEAAALLTKLESGTVYDATDVHPDAPNDLILARINAHLERLDPKAEPGSAVHSARGAFERFRKVFSSLPRRLAYDFLNGQVRAAERLAAGEDIATLRGVWARVHPAEAAAAEEAAARATDHASHARFGEALVAADEALATDPFQPRLIEARAQWDGYRELANRMKEGEIESAREWGSTNGVESDELRRVWSALYPSRIERAKLQARRAMQAISQRRFDEAVQNAERAYELDPFNPQLPTAIETWKREAATAEKP